MKALQVMRVGDARSDSAMLQLNASAPLPVLEPTSSHLLLRVLTCALNPADYKFMNGTKALPKGASSSAATLPYTPGLEVCGVVEAVGAKAAGAASGASFRIGDRVVAALRPQSAMASSSGGGLAEYVVVEAALCAVVPSSISSVDAATLPLAGALALKVIKDAAIDKDSRVLVLGASTCVGAMVVELAKRVAGAAFVAGTTIPGESLAKTLPLDLVVPVAEGENWSEKHYVLLHDQRLDVVVDCLGGRGGGAGGGTGAKGGGGGGEIGVDSPYSWRLAEKLLVRSRRSRCVVLLGDLVSDGLGVQSTQELLAIGARSVWKSLWRSGPQLLYVGQFPSTATLLQTLALVEEQKLTPRVDATLSPLPFTAEALHQAVVHATAHDLHHTRGKTVFQVAE